MIPRPIINLNCCPVPGGERGHAWEPIIGFPAGSFARRCSRCGLCFLQDPLLERLQKIRDEQTKPVPVPEADASWTLVKWLAGACLITALWALKACT